jgi:hypothetical protein
MDILIDIILKAGRSAVELALFVLLPVMVVMLSLMRLLEARGALDWRSPAGAAAAPLRTDRTGRLCRLADQFRQLRRADGDADHDGTARHLGSPPGRHAGHGLRHGAGQLRLSDADHGPAIRPDPGPFAAGRPGRGGGDLLSVRPPSVGRRGGGWTKPCITRLPTAPRACST